MTRPAGRTSPSGRVRPEHRLEWGPAGVKAVAAPAVVVIVDVLRFSTAVEAASSRGATVYPHGWHCDSLQPRARRLEARVADGSAGLSLSPLSLLALHPGERVLLPSPNGASCSLLAAGRGTKVVAACLRNAGAVASYLDDLGAAVTVIACGERWPDGSLRPAVEDLLGAGAVLSRLRGRLSPGAGAAAAAFLAARAGLADGLMRCRSGTELVAAGRRDDVAYAAELDVSQLVPVLDAECFRAVAT